MTRLLDALANVAFVVIFGAVLLLLSFALFVVALTAAATLLPL